MLPDQRVPLVILVLLDPPDQQVPLVLLVLQVPLEKLVLLVLLDRLDLRVGRVQRVPLEKRVLLGRQVGLETQGRLEKLVLPVQQV